MTTLLLVKDIVEFLGKIKNKDELNTKFYNMFNDYLDHCHELDVSDKYEHLNKIKEFYEENKDDLIVHRYMKQLFSELNNNYVKYLFTLSNSKRLVRNLV